MATTFPGEQMQETQPREDLSLPVSDDDGGSRWGKAHHVLLVFAACAIGVWLLSGFYKVKADEVAIVERLGQFVGSDGKAALIEQGLHYHLPWPIDEVFKIPVQQTRTLTVNTFFAPMDEYADYKPRPHTGPELHARIPQAAPLRSLPHHLRQEHRPHFRRGDLPDHRSRRLDHERLPPIGRCLRHRRHFQQPDHGPARTSPPVHRAAHHGPRTAAHSDRRRAL